MRIDKTKILLNNLKKVPINIKAFDNLINNIVSPMKSMTPEIQTNSAMFFNQHIVYNKNEEQSQNSTPNAGNGMQ